MSHCCAMMRGNVDNTCDQHDDRFDCPDCLVNYEARSDSYGLIIHDGGHSVITISHCPWCGTHLPGKEPMMVDNDD